MKKFLVLYLTPISVMEDWMKKSPAERKPMEDDMKVKWESWAEKNKASIVDASAGIGKAKTVAKDGVTDTRNDIMMYGTIQANSQEEAAALFTNHAHLETPQSTIEIMEIISWE
jgi:hypothetical protein